ncbi:hypothetical protein JXI42_02915 [bacterium]|nr:hypothetical protein [bacterium]
MCTPQTLDIPDGIGALVNEEGAIKIRARGGDENTKVAFVVYATRAGYKDHPVVVPSQAMD